MGVFWLQSLVFSTYLNLKKKQKLYPLFLAAALIPVGVTALNFNGTREMVRQVLEAYVGPQIDAESSSASVLPATLKLYGRTMVSFIYKLVLTSVDYPNDAPDPDDPLQLPRRVTDGRRVIAALDGVGPKRTQALYDTIKKWNKKWQPEQDALPDLNQLLFWATMSKVERNRLQVKVPGWGEGTYRRVRDQFPLYDGPELAQDLHVYNSWMEEDDAVVL